MGGVDDSTRIEITTYKSRISELQGQISKLANQVLFATTLIFTVSTALYLLCPITHGSLRILNTFFAAGTPQLHCWNLFHSKANMLDTSYNQQLLLPVT